MRDTVLVVEDCEDQRSLISSLLEEDGFEVRSCANALEALALLRHWSPSVVLLDWYMPFLGGEAFVEGLRTDERLAHTPVIVLTGALQLNAQGVDAVLLKPVDHEELVGVVRRLIARNPQRNFGRETHG